MIRWSVPLASALTILAGSAAAIAAGPAGSPDASASPAPVASADPSASPFPWPTLPPPSAPAEAFRPSGPPDASVTRLGMTVELWLSTDRAAPGDLVEAVARITNNGSEPAYGMTGPCLARPLMTSDLSSVIAPGVEQSGNAAEFKRALIDSASLTTAVWEEERSRQQPQGSGIVVQVLADCGAMGRSFDRVGPGRTLEQRWSWYPSDPLDGGEAWWRPLPPGVVPVTLTWLHAGRGRQAPSDRATRLARPVEVTTDLQLTGDDPGLLSMLELADRALAVPEFQAWVDEVPTWTDWDDADLRAWPAGTDTADVALPDFASRAPDGAVQVSLARTPTGGPTVVASVWLDPWTGEALGFTRES